MLGAVIAALTAFDIAGGGGNGGGSPRALLRAAGCTLTTHPSQGQIHLRDLDAKPKWNSDPPTSGPHHEQWVILGAYDEPVHVVQAVHNLEHGSIVVWYGRDVPEKTVDELGRFYQDDPNGMLLSPLPRLGDTIALTAWVEPPPARGEKPKKGKGVLAKCTKYDEDAFKAFRDAYRYQGPEDFPPERLEPGM